MNEADEGPHRGAGGHEAVGGVADEAAKLIGALSDWARDHGTDHAGTAAGAAGTFAAAVHDIGQHIANDGDDCRYCPVCQVIHVVRRTSPEVRGHLSAAAGSLMHAAAGLLATSTGGHDQGTGVEKIDLETGSDWDEDQ